MCIRDPDIKLIREIFYRDSFRRVLFRGRKDFTGIENSAAANAVDRHEREESRLVKYCVMRQKKERKSTISI